MYKMESAIVGPVKCGCSIPSPTDPTIRDMSLFGDASSFCFEKYLHPGPYFRPIGLPPTGGLPTGGLPTGGLPPRGDLPPTGGLP